MLFCSLSIHYLWMISSAPWFYLCLEVDNSKMFSQDLFLGLLSHVSSFFPDGSTWVSHSTSHTQYAQTALAPLPPFQTNSSSTQSHRPKTLESFLASHFKFLISLNNNSLQILLCGCFQQRLKTPGYFLA